MLKVKNNINQMGQLLLLPKKLILYGAGASTKLILQCFYHKGLKEKLEYIVDRNEALDGTWCEAENGIRVKVLSLSHFLAQYHSRIRKEFVILITPFSALWIVDNLDKIEQLDGTETYLYALITDKNRPAPFSFRNAGRPLIPKRIHYIWIGGRSIPQEYQDNIETWKRYCPDYEIVKWDEHNYDFLGNPYTREALEQKQYMYATDYVRKDILYQMGGIYLDTDVELLGPLDDLLYNEAFIGIEDGGQLNSGSGLGAVPGHPAMEGMMKQYEQESFVYDDGSYNLKYNTFYETSYMISKGYELKNQFQKIDGVTCFPREVLMPESNFGLYDTYTEYTRANHKINPYDKTGVHKILERIYRQQNGAVWKNGNIIQKT